MAQSVGLRDATHIIEEIRASVAAWPNVARDCGVRQEHIEAIGKTLLLEI